MLSDCGRDAPDMVRAGGTGVRRRGSSGNAGGRCAGRGGAAGSGTGAAMAGLGITRGPATEAATPSAAKQTAARIQTRSNAPANPFEDGAPSSTTSSATPIAPPSSRIAVLSAVALAKRPPGASATAASLTTGNARPTPTAVSSAAGR